MSGNLAFLDFNTVHAIRPLEPIEALKARIDIVEIVGRYAALKAKGHEFRARCPFHTERTPSFKVDRKRQRCKCFGCGFGGDVIDFLAKIEHLDNIGAIKRLRELVGGTAAGIRPAPVRTASEPDPETEAKHQKALEIWRQSEAIRPDLKLPWSYLRERRGIREWDHDRLRWYDSAGCIVAPVNAAAGGLVTGVWRIWPRLEGKVSRYGLGPMGGNASRLFPAEGPQIVIAEGVEDALAAHELTGIPAWAALSAGNMGALVLPERLTQVLIFADRDENGVGLKNARALASRLRSEGRYVEIRLPAAAKDANDVLRARRAA